MISVIKSEIFRNFSLLGWKIVFSVMILVTVVLITFNDLRYADLNGQLTSIHPNTGLWLGLNGFVIVGALNAKADVESNELNQQLIVVPNRVKLFISKLVSSFLMYTIIAIIVYYIDRFLRHILVTNNSEASISLFTYGLAALTMGYIAYALSLLTKSLMISVGFLTIIPTLFLGLFREVLPMVNRFLPFDAINVIFYQDSSHLDINNLSYYISLLISWIALSLAAIYGVLISEHK